MEMELIVFTMENRYFGIDCSEVVKVLEFKNIKESPFLEGNENMVFANNLLDYTGQYTYRTSLLIQPKEKSRVVVHIPCIDDLLTIKEIDIIPVPEFVKKQQNPFLMWGVSEQRDKLIILITFEYYFK